MTPGPEDQWRPPEPPPGRSPRPGPPGAMRPGNRPKWLPWVVIGLIVAIFLVWRAAPASTTSSVSLDYGNFLTLVGQDALIAEQSRGHARDSLQGRIREDIDHAFAAHDVDALSSCIDEQVVRIVAGRCIDGLGA